MKKLNSYPFYSKKKDIKHWGMSLLEQRDQAAQTLKNRPVVLRNRRQKRKTSEGTVNLPYFYYNFSRDHSLPNLIWNHKVKKLQSKKF